MRKFVFTDMDEDEKDALLELIKSEGIRYNVRRENLEIPCEGEEEDFIGIFTIFHVDIFTTLEKYDFLNVLLKQKMEKLELLEKCFMLKPKKKRKKATKK